jgi:acetyl-CoA synthetase
VSNAQRLRRLLAPRSIAVVGGQAAAEVIRQSRAIGFPGPIWPVHRSRPAIEGLPCVREVEALPEAPDAAFVAVPAEATVDVVRSLATLGAGGAVCYASGFAEIGPEGARRQQNLVRAAGDLPVIGPNCYGFLNYLDGAALWPDVHGGRAVEHGVAVVTQSGNLGLNVTMQRRGLPLAYLVTGGNMAVCGVPDLLAALADDPRVSAIGLHLEGIDDVAAFSRVAVTAHERGVPLVVLKTGRSETGARVAMSHTSSLSGADELYDALFTRLGIPRVDDVDELLETLMLLHVHGGLPGRRIASASCSGGEASLMADLAHACRLDLPDLGERARSHLADVVGHRVTIRNPLDYHTDIWGDYAAMTACFSGLLSAPIDLGLLVLDVPRTDRCAVGSWTDALEAFVVAQSTTGTRAAVVSTLGEGLPEPMADRLVDVGVAPLRGLRTALHAVAAAADVGAAAERDVRPVPGPIAPECAFARPSALDEWGSKAELRAVGVRTPPGRLLADPDVDARIVAAGLAAEELGYPVVVKAVGTGLEHKTEAGAIALHLDGPLDVRDAAARLAGLAPALLVESMVTGAVAEIMIGARYDRAVGYALTLGAGGVLVELLRDTVTLLLPVTAADVRAALHRLRTGPLLRGHRDRPPADVEAIVATVLAIAGYVEASGGAVVELDVNPLLALPSGQGAVAVDALVVRR